MRAGTATEAVSYDSPTLESVMNQFNYSSDDDVSEEVAGVANLATVGGVEVVLFGANMALDAYTAGARVGQTGCEASAWASDTSLVCKTAGGLYATLRVVLTAGTRAGSLTDAVSYDTPVLDLTRVRVNLPSTGSVSMTVVGSGLGLADYTGASRLGATACEASGWESDSSIRCLSSGGVFGTLRVVVTAGVRVGSVTEALDYDAPGIYANINVFDSSAGNLPPAAASVIRLQAFGFGFFDSSPAAQLGANVTPSIINLHL